MMGYCGVVPHVGQKVRAPWLAPTGGDLPGLGVAGSRGLRDRPVGWR